MVRPFCRPQLAWCFTQDVSPYQARLMSGTSQLSISRLRSDYCSRVSFRASCRSMLLGHTTAPAIDGPLSAPLALSRQSAGQFDLRLYRRNISGLDILRLSRCKAGCDLREEMLEMVVPDSEAQRNFAGMASRVELVALTAADDQHRLTYNCMNNVVNGNPLSKRRERASLRVGDFCQDFCL